MYANKFKTKENKISTEDKNKLNHTLNNKKNIAVYCNIPKVFNYGINLGLH